jgi:hypothetical protein
MSSPASVRSNCTPPASNPIRVVDVAVARPRAYDAESFFGLVSLVIISGVLMAPSLLALLVLTGLL